MTDNKNTANVNFFNGFPKKAYCCWSGGKDCMLALHKAKRSGLDVPYLLNMTSSDGRYSRSHGIGSDLLKRQADLTGCSLVQGRSGPDTYEIEFKNTVRKLKENGISVGIYGDIDLMEHREWIERVARESGVEPLFPLWEMKRKELMDEFIGAGFKAVVCSAHADYLDEGWLGREIDGAFVRDIDEKGGIDLCGEKGEYHSFVYDGPLFKEPVRFKKGMKTRKEKYLYLELLND